MIFAHYLPPKEAARTNHNTPERKFLQVISAVPNFLLRLAYILPPSIVITPI